MLFILFYYNFVVLRRCDVSNREEVFKVAARVKADVGDVTILLNNAGIMPSRPFLETTTEEIRKIFDINVLAHFWVSEISLVYFLIAALEPSTAEPLLEVQPIGFLGYVEIFLACEKRSFS